MTSTTLLLSGQQGLVRGRCQQCHFNSPEPRRLDDFWTPIDPRDVPDGWLQLRNSRLGPQERAATLSATCGDTSYSKVSEKLRSQWSDADLAQHDRHGQSRSHDGNRKSHDRRLGSANLVDLSEVDDERSTHEQLSEFPDGVFGSDDVYHTGEQWDQYEDSFERDEDDVLFHDDEEVQSLIESASEALAGVSQANSTLIQARQRMHQRQRRPLPHRSTVASARDSERDNVSFVVVPIWPVTVLIGTNQLGLASNGSKDNM